MDKDDLTGLFTRKQFEADLTRHSAAAGAQRPLSLLFVDLDLFKDVNDLYGHEAGDEVLVEASRILELVSRDRGVAYRRGGDEFAVLLPDYRIKEASRAAEDIRGRMEKTAFRRCPDAMTVSIGVASYPETAREPAELFLNADTMMYRAKDQGGNCVWPVSGQTSGEGSAMRYMRGDITSRVEALELWMSLDPLSSRSYQINITNDSDEEVVVEGVSLRVGTLYLVRFSKPKEPAEWTIGPRSQKKLSVEFHSEPAVTLTTRNPVNSMVEIDIVVRGRVLGRVRTFSQTILARVAGQRIEQWAPL